MKEFGLTKEEIIRNKDDLEQIFTRAASFSEFPFKVLYRKREFTGVPLQFAVAVPKRKVRKAIKRNLIKRLTREAFRLNKKPLVEELLRANRCMQVVFLYTGTAGVINEVVRQKIILALNRLHSSLAQTRNSTEYEDTQ